MSLLGLGGPHAEDDKTNDGEEEPGVAEPETVFRANWRLISFLSEGGSTAHPEIAQTPSQLFTNDTPYDHTEELKTDLLRVEPEFGEEDLRNLDCEKYRGKVEYDGLWIVSNYLLSEGEKW